MSTDLAERARVFENKPTRNVLAPPTDWCEHHAKIHHITSFRPFAGVIVRRSHMLKCCVMLGLTPMLSQVAAQSVQLVAERPPEVWRTEAQFTCISAVRTFGDGSMLATDPCSKEVFRIGARGKSTTAIRTIPFPKGAAGDLTGTVLADHVGRLYYVALDSVVTSMSRDMELRRMTLSSGVSDRLTTLLGPALDDARVEKGAGGRSMGVSRMIVPYAAQDGFTVAPNGVVVLVRATKRIEWLDATGKVMATKPLPSPAEIPVSPEARAKVEPASLRALVPTMRLAISTDYVVATDDGDVWLQRVGARSRAFTEWYVVSRTGRPTRLISVPGRARLLAVRGTECIVAQTNADDLEAVAVYRVR